MKAAYNLQAIARRAHQVAATCEGDRAARMSLGFAEAWAEARSFVADNKHLVSQLAGDFKFNGKLYPADKKGIRFTVYVNGTDYRVRYDEVWYFQALANAPRVATKAATSTTATTTAPKTVNSGYGFNMRNTARNRALCSRYGYDAIEMVD